MRIAIIGNSGSGKSTLARWLASRAGAPILDLDTVAWEPGQIAVSRSADAAARDVQVFCAVHESWVIEGCYADLVGVALAFAPRLVFLNPGETRCITNCRSRPWEPHKYASKAEQDEHLQHLLAWVGQYYSRGGEMALSSHAALFAAYEGRKSELNCMPVLEPPSAELLAWTNDG